MDPKNPEIEDPKLAPAALASYPEGQWSTGLYDCWDDRSTCLVTCCCPCITMGQIVEIVDKGTTSRRRASRIYCSLNAIGWGWRYAFTYRSKLRQLFSLPEAPCADFLVHSCCCVCAISQEYRELKNRGVNPSIGWEANVEKWKREGIQVPPIPASTMTR
ncbi:hypothetical protein RJ639_034536 [Escallonia herrerae]|uniref:POS2 n=1 Tax=Escallonia herrerae TaxID=1293975 RepID=A0AA88WTE0_9ASTE|nr:hypothetical protein RJ639_034536 [Escallonia herrerae]